MSRARAQVTTRSGRGAPARGKPAARRRPPAKTKDGMLPRIPLPEGLVRTVRNWSFGIIAVAAVIGGLIVMGVPQMTGMATAHGLGRMGFVVRNIQLTGLKQVDRDTVYRIVSEAHGQDMPLVDLSQLRSQLLQLGWIEDARVSRRLPDTLAIDLVERVPAAVLQRNQQLSLIDAQGHVLAAVDAHTMPVQLPLVIGDGVEGHIGALQALIASQAPLKQLIDGATWVGQRRWDLRFQSGETLSLPEGDGEALKALATFAKKDQEARLLGQGYVRIDMRDPTRMVVRTSSDPGERIKDPTPPPPPADPAAATSSTPA
ncbi:MAG TPA: cell division protein FtsQ/DivIB [Sphingomonas sp.]|uniref:cell division protein FtsQ/DivIB n=1 Tax=Sphingomonas sp. TaxID=28214 RepID=UPI002B98414C|nr:cell division protein FtsQ/DivIB [Sphingomonas sp.]HMI20174.1 cell division protein FtsQ/DivIB [Sphingomonas sp.]